MGKDNTDYFKRAGRSIGPAGPLDHFKSTVSQKRALLRRDMEHRLPGERPITGERPAGWLNPPEGGENPAQAPQPRPGGPQAPRARAGGPAQAPLPAQPPKGAPPSPRPRAGGPQPPRPAPPRPAPPRAATVTENRDTGGPTVNRDTGGLAALESRNQEPASRRPPGPVARALEGATHDLEPREQEAPYGFGIPASEEAALGSEREPRERFGHPHEGRAHARWLEARSPPMGERMARRFPQPFRLLGDAADVFGRPIRRALDRLHTLGEIARRS